ncbi:MAG: RnfH family protein [Sterolibacterium sp.]|nr:RnfH family protein [Sterolibacterium sp.]
MASVESITVEVIYALPQQQDLVQLQLPSGSSLQQAVEQSGLLAKYPEIDLTRNKLGIYGKLSKADTMLRDRDRVEIYRPLIADPKEVRKQRVAEGKAMKKGGGAAQTEAPVQVQA